jgi:hypothetical protein
MTSLLERKLLHLGRAIGNRSQTYKAIDHLATNQHRYQREWTTLNMTSAIIVETAIAAIEKYEKAVIGGLTLHGRGIWLLHMILLHCRHQQAVVDLLQYSALESLSRNLVPIALTDPVHYTTCFSILEYLFLDGSRVEDVQLIGLLLSAGALIRWR